VAKAIRDAVNANPRLKGTIQFNASGVPMLQAPEAAAQPVNDEFIAFTSKAAPAERTRGAESDRC
jgi:hypothetical protein